MTGISAYLNVYRCMYSSVEALVVLYIYIHACIVCLSDQFLPEIYGYRIYIESTTLSIPHVRSTHKNYTSTRRTLDKTCRLQCLITCKQDCHLFISDSCYESTDCAVGVFHSAACGRYIDASSHLFDIHYDTTQGFKHGKNMYISKKFESRHGPYNI